jgi:replicative DNA helicase
MPTELYPEPAATGRGRIPPNNLEAEQSVLGGIMFDNSALPRAIESLKTGEEFYKPAHKLIFAAFLELFEKSEPIDLMTVSERLRKKRQLDEVGGLNYLGHLMELFPTAANVGIHARIVREKAVLRRLITTAGELANLGFEDTEEVDEVIERAEKMVFELAEERIQRGFHSFKDVINKTIKHIEDLFDNKGLLTGLPSGFTDLDKKTTGFQPGDLIIMAGRPAMGKTAICINIAEHLAIDKEKVVAFFSLEMSAMQLSLRMLSSQSQISMHMIRGGYLSKDQWPTITRAVQELYEASIFIDDQPMQTVLEIRAKARRLKAEKGLDVIIIDYLQLLSSRGKVENRVQELSEMTRSLKGMARELNVPVIVISQLSRKVEDRHNKRPQLADLRESGSIEQDADLVCFIYRAEYYDDKKFELKGKAEIIIGKQRNGPTGRIPLTFINEIMRFHNASPQDMVDFEAGAEEF